MHLKTAILSLIILASCKSKTNEKKTIIPVAGQIQTTIPFETATLEIGDSIKVYGGHNSILSSQIISETCSGIVTDFAFSKPIGDIAFVEFDNHNAHGVAYSLDLYYINAKQGYKESKLRLWQRELTVEDKKQLAEHWSCGVSYFQIEEGLKFDIVRHKKVILQK